MGGYKDEYEEDLDEYEDEEAEGERYEGYEDEYEEGYEEEEEEDPQPTKEVQDYLVLRQRLKEEKRKQLKKELGTSGNASSREKKNSIIKSNDNYGSFFGSSQPVIAQRVIQESKSLLENPHLLERATKSKNMVTKNTGPVPDSVGSKSQTVVQTPKVVNGVHKKVQLIKHIRDYSFLDSDDAEPATKDPPRKHPPPKSEVRTPHSSDRNKELLSSSNGRKNLPSQRNDKRSIPINGQTRPSNIGNHKPTTSSSDPRKQVPVSNGDKNRILNKISSGPGRPMVSKSAPPSRVPMPSGKSSASLTHKAAPSRPQISGSSKPASKQQVSGSGSKQNVVGRREHEELRKQKVVPKQYAREELSKQKVLPKQGVNEDLRKRTVLPKQVAARHEELRRQTVLPRQGAPSSKPKVTQPPQKSSARPMAVDDRSRKRPMRPRDDDDEPAEDYRKMIRGMFKYNPSKYGDDDDVSDMEANFEEIEREEKRSARIARKEDEEELRKIEEEERRERMRKEAKKRKLH